MSRPKPKEMDLTVGNPFWSLLKFAIPVILGNLFQLFYTLADSVIVGKTLGADSDLLSAGSPDSPLDADSGGYFRRSLRLHVCRSSWNGSNCFLQYDFQHATCTGRQ